MHSSLSTRRNFLGAAAAFTYSRGIATGQPISLRIGVTDWNLNLGAKPEAVSKAAELGFRGVQVSFGRELADGKMPADDPDKISAVPEVVKATRSDDRRNLCGPVARQRPEERSAGAEMGFRWNSAYPRLENEGASVAVFWTLGS